MKQTYSVHLFCSLLNRLNGANLFAWLMVERIFSLQHSTILSEQVIGRFFITFVVCYLLFSIVMNDVIKQN